MAAADPDPKQAASLEVNPYASPKALDSGQEREDESESADAVLHRRVLWARRIVIVFAGLTLLFIARDPWSSVISTALLGTAYVVSRRSSPLLGLLLGFATLVPRWSATLALILGMWEEALLAGTEPYFLVASTIPTGVGVAVGFAVALVLWRGIAAAARLYGDDRMSWALIRPVLLVSLGLTLLSAVEFYSGGQVSRYAAVLEVAWAALAVSTVWNARGEWLGLLRGRRLQGKDLFFVVGGLLALAAFTSEYRWFAKMAPEAALPSRGTFFLECGLPPALVVVLLVGCVPLVHEFVFRGFAQSRLERVMTPGRALIAQAALFSAAHGVEGNLVGHLVAGVTLGWLRNRARNLYAPIALQVSYSAWITLSELGYLSGPLALD